MSFSSSGVGKTKDAIKQRIHRDLVDFNKTDTRMPQICQAACSLVDALPSFEGNLIKWDIYGHWDSSGFGNLEVKFALITAKQQVD